MNRASMLKLLGYPLILAAVGFGFNWYLDKTKRLEIAEKVVERLFVDKPIDAFAADSLLDYLISDRQLRDRLHLYTLETWKGRLQDAVDGQDDKKAREIANAATTVGKDVGQQVLVDIGRRSSPQRQQLQDVSQSKTTGNQRPSIEPSSIPDNKPISSNLSTVAAILPDIRAAESKSPVPNKERAWVYLGVTNAKGKWLSKNFTDTGMAKEPQELKGQVVTTSVDVFKRDQAPYYVEQSGWKLGDVVGVVKKNDNVKTEDIKEVPGTGNTRLWWAWVAQ